MKTCSFEFCNRKHEAKGFCEKHYRKTKYAFLSKAYKNLRQRCTGVQTIKQHIYLGLEYLDKETFIEWSLNNQEFNNLFTEFENSLFDRCLSPSVDRKDSSKGYVLDNIRWITNSENSILGNKSIKRDVSL